MQVVARGTPKLDWNWHDGDGPSIGMMHIDICDGRGKFSTIVYIDERARSCSLKMK